MLSSFAGLVAFTAVAGAPQEHPFVDLPMGAITRAPRNARPRTAWFEARDETDPDRDEDGESWGEGLQVPEEHLAAWIALACPEAGLRVESSPSFGSLRLSGDAAALERGRAAFAKLEALVQRPLELEVAVWRVAVAPEEPRVRYAAADFEALTASATRLWVTRQITRAHQHVELRAVRSTPYVGDAEVEVVTEGEFVQAPRIQHVEEGLSGSLLAIACGGPDDGVLVLGELGFGALRAPLAPMPTGVPGQPDLETGELEHFRARFSGRAPDGESLVLWSLGDEREGPSILISVTPHWRTPGPQFDDGVELLPVGTAPRLRIDRGFHEPDELGPLWERRSDTFMDIEPPGTTLPIGERSAADEPEQDPFRLAIEALEAATDADALALGPWLAVRAAPDERGRVRAAIESIVESRVVMHMLTIDATDGAGALVHRVVVPTLTGRGASVLRGALRRAIIGFQIEAAGRSDMANPVARTCFDGLFGTVRVRPALRGVLAQVTLGMAARGPIATREDGTLPGGRIDATEASFAWHGAEAVLTDGAAMELGAGAELLRDGVRRPTFLRMALR